jgi:hypothetical protein
MDATDALTELVCVSTQVVEAVVTGPSGAVEGARAASEPRAKALAEAGSELLSVAAEIRVAEAVERVQVDLHRGSLVALTDGTRAIVATTVAEPTTALVALDLRTALRRVRGEGR